MSFASPYDEELEARFQALKESVASTGEVPDEYKLYMQACQGPDKKRRVRGLGSMAPEYYDVMSIAQSSVQPPHNTRAEASSSRTHESTPSTQELMTQIVAIQSRLESFETWQARLEAIERGVPLPEDDRDRLHLHVDFSTMQFHRQQAQADLENVARLREVVARLEMENEQLRRSQTCDQPQLQPQPDSDH